MTELTHLLRGIELTLIADNIKRQRNLRDSTRWITINGGSSAQTGEKTGRAVEIDQETGRITKGFGTGKTLDQAFNPEPETERQKLGRKIAEAGARLHGGNEREYRNLGVVKGQSDWFANQKLKGSELPENLQKDIDGNSEGQTDKKPFYSSFDSNEESQFKSNLKKAIEGGYSVYNRSKKIYEYPGVPSDSEIEKAIDKIVNHFKETGEIPKQYGKDRDDYYPINIFKQSPSIEALIPYKTRHEIYQARQEKLHIAQEKTKAFIESKLPELKIIAEQHGMPESKWNNDHPVNQALKEAIKDGEVQGHGYLGNSLTDAIKKHLLDKEINDSRNTLQGGSGIEHAKKLFALKRQGKLNNYELTDNDIDALIDAVNNKTTPTGLSKKEKFDASLIAERNITDKIKSVPKKIKPPIQTTQDKIEQAAEFAGYKDSREYLNGVYIDTQNKRIVASDGHMLAMYQDDSLTGDNHLLETKSLKRDIIFDYNDWRYPDFSKVFEGNFNSRLGVNGKELAAKLNGVDGLKRAFTTKEYNKNTVRLSDGDNSNVFQNDYLLKAISAASRKNGKVDISFSNREYNANQRNTLQNIIIRPHNDMSESYVVMPMLSNVEENGLGNINLSDYLN